MQLIEYDVEDDTMARPDHVAAPRGKSPMERYVRRSLIGIASGLIASVALATTLHSAVLGIALGAAIGGLYGIAARPTPLAYAESVFTAASLAIPFWTLLSVILLPVLAGEGAQWDADAMRAALPQLVGWILYGAVLGLLTQTLNDAADRILGGKLMCPSPQRWTRHKL